MNDNKMYEEVLRILLKERYFVYLKTKSNLGRSEGQTWGLKGVELGVCSGVV
jgi:hypothetical protein